MVPSVTLYSVVCSIPVWLAALYTRFVFAVGTVIFFATTVTTHVAVFPLPSAAVAVIVAFPTFLAVKVISSPDTDVALLILQILASLVVQFTFLFTKSAGSNVAIIVVVSSYDIVAVSLFNVSFVAFFSVHSAYSVVLSTNEPVSSIS